MEIKSGMHSSSAGRQSPSDKENVHSLIKTKQRGISTKITDDLGEPWQADGFLLGDEGKKDIEARLDKAEKIKEKLQNKEELLNLEGPDSFDQLQESIELLRDLKENHGELNKFAKNRRDLKMPGMPKKELKTPPGKPAGDLKPGVGEKNTPSYKGDKSPAFGAPIDNNDQVSSGPVGSPPSEKEPAPANEPPPEQPPPKEEINQDSRKSEAESHKEQIRSREDQEAIQKKAQLEQTLREIKTIDTRIEVIQGEIINMEKNLEELIWENLDNPDFDPEPLRLLIEQKKNQLRLLEQERIKKILHMESLDQSHGDIHLDSKHIDGMITRAILDKDMTGQDQYKARILIENNLELLEKNPHDLSRLDTDSNLSNVETLKAVRDLKNFQELVREKKH